MVDKGRGGFGGFFSVFGLFSEKRKPSVFACLSLELVKAIHFESKRIIAVTSSWTRNNISLLGAAYSNAGLGLPLVRCPKLVGGLNSRGSRAPAFPCSSAMCWDVLFPLSHNVLQVGGPLLHGQSWLPFETLLLRSCLAGNQRPILWSISCVLPLDYFIWSSILEEPGQLQSLHFSVHRQKGAVFHAEASTGDILYVF